MKRYRCPECKDFMMLLEVTDSLLGIAEWNRFGCQNCAATFQIKVAKMKSAETIGREDV